MSFSADATRITVGAPNAMGGIGRLGVYDFKDGRWELVGESIFGDNPGANFGGDSGMTIMSGDGSRFIVGANLDNEGGTNAGIARVFEIKDRCEAIDTIEVIENPDSPVDPTDPCADFTLDIPEAEVFLTDAPFILTGGSVAGGSFEYADIPTAIVDNADGTYSFDPSIAGLGTHQITYGGVATEKEVVQIGDSF